jgi:Leucine-rich repeat (LRR) protein
MSNKITKIENLINLINLEYLNLNDNRIDKLPLLLKLPQLDTFYYRHDYKHILIINLGLHILIYKNKLYLLLPPS